MKNKLYILLVIGVLCQFKSTAQKGYWEKATLIDSSGIVTEGYVNRNIDQDMSFEIQFKQTKNSSDVMIFSAAALNKVQFESDNAVYEKVLLFEKKSNLSEVRLLKCLLQGYCSLYRLSFEEKETMAQTYAKFVVKKEGKYYILEQKETITHDVYYKKENKFWGVLNYLFQDVKDAGLTSKMKKLDFIEESLIDVIKHYNSMKAPGNKNIIYKEKNAIIAKYGIFTEAYLGSDGERKFSYFGIGAHYETQKTAKSRKRANVYGFRLLASHNIVSSKLLILPAFQLGTNYYIRPQKKPRFIQEED